MQLVVYVFAIMAISVAAFAQQGVDPRIATPALEMLKAEMAYRDAVLKALVEDQAKREHDLAEWFKGYFATPEKEAK